MTFHSKPIEKVFEELNASKEGLTSSEFSDRIKKYGLNEITEKKKISALKIFLNQFKSFIVYILIFAVIVAAILGEWVDAVV